MNWKILTLATSLFAVSTLSTQALVLSEVRTDQPGNPDDEEFVEIMGTPGESLDGVWFLYVGDHSGTGATKGSGVIEIALDLTGYEIPSDGHFLMIGPNFDTTQFDLSLGDVDYLFEGFGNALENSDNTTAMLVRGFTGNGGIEIRGIDDQIGDAAVDIDDNDNGEPNLVLPWTEVIDAVGLFESAASGEFCYGAAFGFVNVETGTSFVASHIWRGDDDGAWHAGEHVLFEEDGNGTVIGIDPNAMDTPGLVNPDSPEVSYPPSISSLSTTIVSEGESIVVTGENLPAVTSVSINTTEASFSLDGSDLVVTIPEGAMTGPLVLTNSDGVATSASFIVIVESDTVIFAEDFANGLNNFSAFSVASDANWEAYSFSDSSSIEANGYGADTASDDWLISPAIDLSAVSNAQLVLGHERVFSGPALEVKVSTNYSGTGAPSLATWSDVSVVLAGDNAGEIVDSGMTDISAFDGETITVAIRYTTAGTGSGEGAVDRIHYVVVMGEGASSEDWENSAEFGWIYKYSNGWAYTFDFDYVYISNFPWVYQKSVGWMYHSVRIAGTGTWFYSSSRNWIYVGQGEGAWYKYQSGDGWAYDNFASPQG